MILSTTEGTLGAYGRSNAWHTSLVTSITVHATALGEPCWIQFRQRPTTRRRWQVEEEQEGATGVGGARTKET